MSWSARVAGMEPACDHTLQAFVLFNVYFPSSGGGEEDRLAFKVQFHASLTCRVSHLLAGTLATLLSIDSTPSCSYRYSLQLHLVCCLCCLPPFAPVWPMLLSSSTMTIALYRDRVLFHLLHPFLFLCCTVSPAGRDVVIVGDMNVVHRAIDHCDPASFAKHCGPSGLAKWMDIMLETAGACALLFVFFGASFRELHSNSRA